MKNLPIVAALILAVGAAIASVPAAADTLYSDTGPYTDIGYANLILDNGDVVTDSFTLAKTSTITGADFSIWLDIGDSLSSIEWSIGAAAFGGVPAVAVTTDEGQVGTGFENTRSIDLESIAIPSITLAAGNYWFTLQDASASNGDIAGWDYSNGPSTAFEEPYGLAGTTSSSFDIYGTAAVTPEPSSFLLVGTGLAGLAGLIARKTMSWGGVDS